MNFSVRKNQSNIHLLGIEGMQKDFIIKLLDRADQIHKFRRIQKFDTLKGQMVMNLFFENSTRTRVSFEIASKALGGDTLNISVSSSSIKKGETLIDTATTLNAMNPDFLILRHPNSGASSMLSKNVKCSIINAGDGRHEHPTQALLDAAVIRQNKGRLEGLKISICGDISNSRVARSNIHLLTTMGAQVRVVGPPTLIPTGIARMGVDVFTDIKSGLLDVDIIMILRLQSERMNGAEIPSRREFHHLFGINEEKLKLASKDVLIMHPGPMNRGVEIDSKLADNNDRSLISSQVEIGVAVRMACLQLLFEARKINNL